MSLNVGDRLGHYDVTALIGEGGMGQVSQAERVPGCATRAVPVAHMKTYLAALP